MSPVPNKQDVFVKEKVYGIRIWSLIPLQFAASNGIFSFQPESLTGRPKVFTQCEAFIGTYVTEIIAVRLLPDFLVNKLLFGNCK